MTELEKLKKELEKVQVELDKYGQATTLTHGFGTSRYAKASRKADYYAIKRHELRMKIEELS